MTATTEASSFAQRASIAIYWIPGCSSCAKVKEFVQDHGLEFESFNVLEHPAAMEEVTAAGLQGVPAIRHRDKFAYAQSLDDLAEFLGIVNRHTKLPLDVLLRRWDDILEKAKFIIASFDEETLQRRVMPQRERSIRQLGVHTFQVAESFLRQVEDDTIDARAIYLDRRDDISTRDDVILYAESIHAQYREAFLSAASKPLVVSLNTHYGQQPMAQVLERGVWHTAQHARQLDFVAAGIGFELQIDEELYSDLPMPRRLWS